jgi:hypothetical protein
LRNSDRTSRISAGRAGQPRAGLNYDLEKEWKREGGQVDGAQCLVHGIEPFELIGLLSLMVSDTRACADRKIVCSSTKIRANGL